MPKIVFLWTDVVVLLLLLALVVYIWRMRRSVNMRVTWHKVFRDPAALCSAVILVVFLGVAIVDSVHYRSALAAAAGSKGEQAQAYSTRTESLLGALVAGLIAGLVAWVVARRTRGGYADAWRLLLRNQTELPLRAGLVTVLALCAVFGPVFALAAHYHVFGTDRTGNDVFYQAIKSI